MTGGHDDETFSERLARLEREAADIHPLAGLLFRLRGNQLRKMMAERRDEGIRRYFRS